MGNNGIIKSVMDYAQEDNNGWVFFERNLSIPPEQKKQIWKIIRDKADLTDGYFDTNVAEALNPEDRLEVLVSLSFKGFFCLGYDALCACKEAKNKFVYTNFMITLLESSLCGRKDPNAKLMYDMLMDRKSGIYAEDK